MNNTIFRRSFFIVQVIVMIMSLLSFWGCSGKQVDESNPNEIYKDAEEDITDERYTMALDKLKNLKNRFPYSNLATTAKLRIADVYFLQESYIEAAGAYESFRDMHPKHEKADYVLFRIGESYYNQLPSTDDRDLTPATKAIDAYNELLQLYPKSQFLTDAQTHLKTATERLANKEKYIADFYYSHKQYDSAAGRYEKLTKTYPNSTVAQDAYWRWSQSLIRDNKGDEAKHVLKVYLSRFPSGTYSKDANKWLAGGTAPKEGETE
jgi:outer membrane protein assembly factor BamD